VGVTPRQGDGYYRSQGEVAQVTRYTDDHEVREMRTAETMLNIIRDRGQRGLPIEDVYRLLYHRDLYLRAYAKLYANQGAMTPGVTTETVDAMSLAKIDNIIQVIRQEKYRWMPVRREYIEKKNSTKKRPLGLPTWSDKLLQEAIRSILEAYYDPQFSTHSHGFRRGRGCHTALGEITQHWRGAKWFIEGDICSCFDRIDHNILIQILQEKIHDNRFIRLMSNLLQAGYLEEWHYNTTLSGVPQGGVISPILSNLVLDRLDKYVEQILIPEYTRGRRRQTNRLYGALTKAASAARKLGNREQARDLNKQAQAIPSKDTHDPNFRRLWYVRYADDWLLGFAGPKGEAEAIKRQLAQFLREALNLELSDTKTRITHARQEKAHFLGYELHTLHANGKHDQRGQRCINGAIGLRIPNNVIKAKSANYMNKGEPIHLAQRTLNDAYSVVTQYQAEYVGIVQYYRLAYNLHQMSRLKRIMELSLVKTLAKKYKTTCAKIYRKFRTTLEVEQHTYRVLQVTQDRGPDKSPLVTYFGGVPLRWNKWVTIHDTVEPIWNRRSELIDRLLAQRCELCGSTQNIQVHHIRKLADLNRQGQTQKADWARLMAARHRKTLIVCLNCHNKIHYGRYDGPAIAGH
jgi:group II intron reverse transcriptase/maturase